MDMASRILPLEDRHAAQVVAAALVKNGVEILTGAIVSSANIDNVGKGFLRIDRGGGETRQLDFDRLLVAVGRSPRTSNLGLNLDGVELNNNGFLKVDASLRPTHKRSWAAGDVTEHTQLPHVAELHASGASSNAVPGLRETDASELRPR